MTAARTCFQCSGCEDFGDELRIPGRSERDWLRKTRAALSHVPVKYFVVKNCGNAESRVFDQPFLNRVGKRRSLARILSFSLSRDLANAVLHDFCGFGRMRSRHGRWRNPFADLPAGGCPKDMSTARSSLRASCATVDRRRVVPPADVDSCNPEDFPVSSCGQQVNRMLRQAMRNADTDSQELLSLLRLSRVHPVERDPDPFVRNFRRTFDLTSREISSGVTARPLFSSCS